MCTFGASDLCMIRFREMKSIRVSELQNDSVTLNTPPDFFQLERFALSHPFNDFSAGGGGIKIFYRLFIVLLETFATPLRFAFIRPQFSPRYGRKNTTEAEGRGTWRCPLPFQQSTQRQEGLSPTA